MTCTQIFEYSYDQDGRTPLYAASEKCHEGIMKELIAAGANINQADKVRYNQVFVITFSI